MFYAVFQLRCEMSERNTKLLEDIVSRSPFIDDGFGGSPCFYCLEESVHNDECEWVRACGLLGVKYWGWIDDTKRIVNVCRKAGYKVTYQLLDASKMGVPQKRERVFFFAIRNDLFDKIELEGPGWYQISARTEDGKKYTTEINVRK